GSAGPAAVREGQDPRDVSQDARVRERAYPGALDALEAGLRRPKREQPSDRSDDAGLDARHDGHHADQRNRPMRITMTTRRCRFDTGAPMRARVGHARVGHARAGFTLVEVLLTLLIMGMIMVSMTQILTAARTSRDTIHNIQETELAGPAILDMIER